MNLLVKWEEEPKLAEVDETFELQGGNVTVYKGDWYCKGKWFQKVPGAKNWWTTHALSTIVRLETVLNADVILPKSGTNLIRSFGRLARQTKAAVNSNGAWRVSDEVDLFMVEESRRRNAWEYDEDMVTSVREKLVAAGASLGNTNDEMGDGE